VRQLSEQLRRFLDDQVWFENRRVIDILRDIESHALELRERRDVPVSADIDGAAPAIRLPMERPLYAPVHKARIDSQDVRPADEETDAHIGKAVDLGFLRPAKNAEPVYEVRRILKAFVDAQWLADFDAKLAG
jgi:Protein of unknown function (DUF3375)